MRLIGIIVGALILLIIGFFVLNNYIYTEKQGDGIDTTLEGRTYSTYADEWLGFLFSYPVGENGYAMTEPQVGIDDSGLQKIIVLTDAKEANILEENPVIGGEGPPTITILVFDNPEGQTPLLWAETNTLYSNIELKRGKINETVIGGANAIQYMADGLYASEIAIVAHGSHVYIVNGGFMDVSSAIRKDFKSIIESFTFIPEPRQ